MTRDELHDELEASLAASDKQAFFASMNVNAAQFYHDADYPYEEPEEMPRNEKFQSPLYYAAKAVKLGVATPAEAVPAVLPALTFAYDRFHSQNKTNHNLWQIVLDETMPDRLGFVQELDRHLPVNPEGRGGWKLWQGMGLREALGAYDRVDAAFQAELAPHQVKCGLESVVQKGPNPYHFMRGPEDYYPRLLQSTERAAGHPQRLRTLVAVADICSGAGIKNEQMPILGSGDIDAVANQLELLATQRRQDGTRGRRAPRDIGYNAGDMFANFRDQMIMPAFAMAHHKRVGSVTPQDLQAYQLAGSAIARQVLIGETDTQKALSWQRTLMLFARYQVHRDAIDAAMPAEPPESWEDDAWEAYTPDLVLDNGVRMHFVTSRDELAAAADRFANCSKGRTNRCLREHYHIGITTTPDGQEAMTEFLCPPGLPVRIVEGPCMPKNDDNPYQECHNPLLAAASEEFLTGANAQRYPVDDKKLARRLAFHLRKKPVIHDFTSICGYDPLVEQKRDAMAQAYHAALSNGNYRRLGSGIYEDVARGMKLHDIAAKTVVTHLSTVNRDELAAKSRMEEYRKTRDNGLSDYTRFYFRPPVLLHPVI